MDIAHEVAKRSKDPSTQVGCVIVNQEHKPISFGYNGMVQSCYEEHMTWERPMKYELVIHAEMNAILFAKEDLFNAKLYCTHIPCVNCFKTRFTGGNQGNLLQKRRNSR
jgi:dCMP deaminase